MRILIIHGPNLNLLGKREPEIYGTESLDDLNAAVSARAQDLGVDVTFYQSNHEGEIIDRIQKADASGDEGSDGIMINPGAFTHTSLAITDALSGVSIPAVEVHLSNIYARGELRAKSLTASACVGQISGFGITSYVFGLEALVAALRR